MDNVNVKMVRPHLDDIPDYPCPEGFHLRPFAAGDEDTWVDLYRAAEPYHEINRALFDAKFDGNVAALTARMLFLVHNNRGVMGTAVAWYDDKEHTADWGRLHWVALHPDYQAQGLSKPLVAATLHRLVALGHLRAYLLTSTGRTAAIRLYQRFGFVPQPRNDTEVAAWERFFDRNGGVDVSGAHKAAESD